VENNSFKKLLTPPEFGLSKLRLKLDLAEKDVRKESIFMGSVAAALAATLIFFVILNPMSGAVKEKMFSEVNPPLTIVTSTNIQATEVPGTPAGIHFYWLFK